MIVVAKEESVPTVIKTLPEYFAGVAAEGFILGELRCYSSPEMLVTSLREHILQQWPTHSPVVLFRELYRALHVLEAKGLVEILDKDFNPKIRRVCPE